MACRDGMTDFYKSVNIGNHFLFAQLYTSPALQAAGYEVLSLTGTDSRGCAMHLHASIDYAATKFVLNGQNYVAAS